MQEIQRIAVIGAGVMGRQLAAFLAGTGAEVDLLDIVVEGEPDRNFLATKALKELPKMQPPVLVSDSVLDRIRPGNLEDHWDRVCEADWILEAIVERLDIKRSLYERIDASRPKAKWITSNTSGLSIHDLAEGRSDGFRERFFGTHFFNPPRYLPLLEVIPHKETDRQRMHVLIDWLIRYGGKRVVYAKDRPNFIANRLGIFQTLVTLRLMEEMNLSVEEVDALTGPLLGRPKSATFQTLDLVGLDIFAATLQTLVDRAVDDEFHEWFRMPEWLNHLLSEGALGRKAGKGVYFKKDDGLYVFDPRSGDYRPRKKPFYVWQDRVKQAPSLAERLAIIKKADPRLYDFVIRCVAYPAIYAARRIPEIADRVIDIDSALRWGFQVKWGPFQAWDDLGFDTILAYESELPPAEAPIIKAMKDNGLTSFYNTEGERPSYFDLSSKTYKPSDDTRPWSSVEWIRLTKRPVIGNAEASLYDLGDGVFALLWHSPNNAIGIDILEMVQRSLDYVADHGKGLIISGTRTHFSYGANLGLLVMALQNRDIAQLDWTIRTFQLMTKSLRLSPFPVVLAAHGMVLGGGCEFLLHADTVVAPVESYIGLVELGAGLIPAGGGCAEIVRRVNAIDISSDRIVPWVHYQDHLAEFFKHVAQAQVARSAYEARSWGYLQDHDIIISDADRRIEVAREVVLGLAEGYRPEPEPRVWVTGEDGFAQLMMMVHAMHRGGYITDYERKLGEKLAWVLTGGDLPHPTQVSLDYIRDLEREAFLSLCRERKTYERVAHIIAFGKPVRN